MSAAARLSPRLARRLDEIADRLGSGIVALDGPTGAGKSTVADALAKRLKDRGVGVLVVRTEDFATWDDPAAWWPDLEREVLLPFIRRRDLNYRPRVWTDGEPHPGPAVWLRWQPLLIIEGVTAARRQISRHLTEALWLDGGSAEQRLARSVARDGEHSRDRLAAWQQFEDGWFAVDRTRSRCLVLDADEPTPAGLAG